MAYDEKYRKRTLEYWHEGHTLAQTREVFRVSVRNIKLSVRLKRLTQKN